MTQLTHPSYVEALIFQIEQLTAEKAELLALASDLEHELADALEQNGKTICTNGALLNIAKDHRSVPDWLARVCGWCRRVMA